MLHSSPKKTLAAPTLSHAVCRILDRFSEQQDHLKKALAEIFLSLV